MVRVRLGREDRDEDGGKRMNMPAIKPGWSPARVVVDSEGQAVNSRRATFEYGVRTDIVFLRGDGWTLGAPKHLESVAYSLWRDEWTHFCRRPGLAWVPIAKYGGPR